MSETLSPALSLGGCTELKEDRSDLCTISPMSPENIDLLNNDILMEKIKDIIETTKLNLVDDNKELQKIICDKLDMHDVLLKERVENNLFELKIQNQQHCWPPNNINFPQPTTLQFDDLETAELKQVDSNNSNIESLPSYYKDIRNMFLNEMSCALKDYTEQKLNIECTNNKCYKIQNQNDIYNCPCIKRICIFLKIYKEHYQQINIEQYTGNMDQCFVIDGYDFTNLCNDFEHIHDCHMLNNPDIQKIICSEIMTKYGCEAKTQCMILTRRARSNMALMKKFDQSSLFIHKLDNIHSYFLHSALYDVINNDQDDSKIEEKSYVIENIKIKKTKYSGKDDAKWIKSIQDIDIEKENTIYITLLKNIGIWRWQGTTGFIRNHAILHLKPRFENVKLEVLNNSFYKLSMDSWTQTVIKAREFKKTLAAQRIRTQYDGNFNDYVLGHKSSWKSGETLTIKEIMVIKLYTDWDDLQRELKKCSRLEDCRDVIIQYTMRGGFPDLPNMNQSDWQPSMLYTSKTSINSEATDKIIVTELEQRLKEFYHWRGKLLMFINKFASILKPTYYDKIQKKECEFILYHGINGKMILNPSSTLSFYGPLSTTSSYYVAQTFATDKGMILSISSQYPKLKICNAFNASTISDYPEEQEWIIGHIYLRIRKIYIKSIPQYIYMDTNIRLSFFVIHLFRQQMFSFDNNLQYYIIPFIQIHLLKVRNINEKEYELMYGNIQSSKHFEYLSHVIRWNKKHKLNKDFSPEPPGVMKQTTEQEIRKNRIFYLLTKQFEQFCRIPNHLQIVKIDCVSDGLKPYFLDYCEKNEEWIVSFKKIINLFVNIKEIHFLNYYKLDDIALEKLIFQIENKEKDSNNKLKQIKFIYYDYTNPLSECPFFVHPDELNKDLKEKLNWKISYPNDTNTPSGFYIKLKENNKKTMTTV